MRIGNNIVGSTKQSYDFARPMGPTASGVMRTTKVVLSGSNYAYGTKAYSIE